MSPRDKRLKRLMKPIKKWVNSIEEYKKIIRKQILNEIKQEVIPWKRNGLS